MPRRGMPCSAITTRTHGKGDAGYKAGQKITIKVNFVGFIRS